MIQLLFGSKEFKKVFEQMSSVRLFIRQRLLFVLTQSHHKLQKIAQKKRKEYFNSFLLRTQLRKGNYGLLQLL
jgi:hypothetical protein